MSALFGVKSFGFFKIYGVSSINQRPQFNQLPSNPLNINLKDIYYKTIELIQKYEFHKFFFFL